MGNVAAANGEDEPRRSVTRVFLADRPTSAPSWTAKSAKRPSRVQAWMAEQTRSNNRDSKMSFWEFRDRDDTT